LSFGNLYVQRGWFASQYWQNNLISEPKFAHVKKLNGNRNRLDLVPGSGFFGTICQASIYDQRNSPSWKFDSSVSSSSDTNAVVNTVYSMLTVTKLWQL